MKTRMLCFLAVLILAASSSVYAAEPAEMGMLRNAWEQARDRAAQPIDEAYVRELQKLLDTLTKGGKLEDALAVKNESQKVAENANAAAAAAEAKKDGGKVPMQLEPLRRSWTHSRVKAVQPSDAIYARELQKIQDSFTKAGRLEDALAVKSELEKVSGKSVGGNEAFTTTRRSYSFVGKKWETSSGSHFILKSDGTGTQANASGKEWPLKWSKGPEDLITVDGWADDQRATLYFQFTKSKEGFFGSTSEKLEKKVTVK